MRRLLSASLLPVVVASLAAACSSTPQSGSHYEEFQCPDPIGRIVREDCTQVGQRYEALSASGATGSAGPFEERALREANDYIAALKEQRVSLCNDFNTCKLSVDQYRNDKQKIESNFTAVVTLRSSAGTLDEAGAKQFSARLHAIREGRPAPPPAPPPPPTVAQPAPPPPPPPKPAPAPEPSGAGAWAPGKFMVQAVARVVNRAKSLEAKTKFGFDIDHACVLGAFLQTGKSIDLNQSFKAGREYVLLGGGSENALDVDLAILEGNKVLAADTDDDPAPLVRFKPARDGTYTIRLRLDRSKASGNFVALAIMHEGGYEIPTKNLVASVGRALLSAATVAKKADAGGYNLVFHEQGNWSFYGTVLKPHEVSSFGGLHFATDPTIALGAGDDEGTNLDIFIKEGTAVAAKDDGPDATPAVLFHPDGSKVYSAAISNPADRGTTMATLLLLDAKK